MKIKTKLMISYFIISVAPLLLVAIIFYFISSNNIKETSSSFINLYTSQMSKEIASYLNDVNELTKGIYHTNITKYLMNEEGLSKSKFIANRLEIIQYLDKLLQQDQNLYGVYILSKQGNLYYRGYRENSINLDTLKRQDWFKEIEKSTGELIVTSVHDTPYIVYNDSGLFSMGRVINDEKGNPFATFVFEVRPTQLVPFNTEMEKMQNQFKAKITIENRAGGLIYQSYPSNDDRDAELYNKKNALIITNESKPFGVKVSVFVPKKYLLSEINNFGNITLMILAVIILILIALSFSLSHNITRPIVQLTKNIKSVETGKYTVMEDIPYRKDEIRILAVSYNEMVLKIKHLIEDVYKAELKQKQAELLALQNQINPHMLNNTLECIRMEAAENKDFKVAEMIKTLAKMFRLALSKYKEENRIRDEVNYIRTYIALQNIGYENKFSLFVELEEDILDAQIINFVFQPIVENSVLHAFDDMEGDCSIRINGSAVGNDMLLQIADNGSGISEEKVKEINDHLNAPSDYLINTDSKIGLKNVHDRIKIRYGGSYYLKVTSVYGQGTTIELLIPKLG